jgi:hypothetical protein
MLGLRNAVCDSAAAPDYVTVGGVSYPTREGFERWQRRMIGTSIVIGVATTIAGRVAIDWWRSRKP